MSTIRRATALAFGLVLALAPYASSQEQTPLAESAPPPPYEEQLLRLSEILGSIYYLRGLCKAPDGDVWRDQMQALIDTEQPDDLRRARIVDRFNRGYESYKAVYLACTPAATLATDRYLAEGAKIAADITARYGK